MGKKWFDRIEKDDLSNEELEEAKTEFRKLGELLNKDGGYDLMSAALESMPKGSRRIVEIFWHGIGGWQC